MLPEYGSPTGQAVSLKPDVVAAIVFEVMSRAETVIISSRSPF